MDLSHVLQAVDEQLNAVGTSPGNAFTEARQAQELERFRGVKWNPRTHPYRVMRTFRSRAHGCGGWLTESLMCASEGEALALAESAERIPGTSRVRVHRVEGSSWKSVTR